MSLGSLLAGWWGCDRCSAMHQRAQAAESEAAQLRALLWRCEEMLDGWAQHCEGAPMPSEILTNRLIGDVLVALEPR